MQPRLVNLFILSGEEGFVIFVMFLVVFSLSFCNDTFTSVCAMFNGHMSSLCGK